MIALLSLAMAVEGSGDEPGFDPSPGLYVPSSAPGNNRVEARAGAAFASFKQRTLGGPRIEIQGRFDRFAGGVDLHMVGRNGEDLRPWLTAWVSVAAVDSPRLRVSPFVRGGELLQGGVSVVARTRGGGVGNQPVTFDAAWGPAFSVERLRNPSWQGPFDLLASLPEAGVTFPLHPNASQQLRGGLMGGFPTVTWRMATRHLVIESSLGISPLGGTANFGIGSRIGAEPKRPSPMP